MPVSIILPFHENIDQLRESLPAVRQSMPDAQILVAADGAREDARPVAAQWGATVIEVTGPAGPATARNQAAAHATGDILMFVDADVVVAPDALPGMQRLLQARGDVAAVFGAYDLTPRAPNFMSQFRNLSHARIHEVTRGDASTFWAGLGAMRASVFHAVGGFDERFRRPSVEDIDLGYRITARGHRVVLDPHIRGTHLKRWTLTSCVRTDIWARGVPWTQLLHRFGTPVNRMNLSPALRLSVVASYGLLASLVALALTKWALATFVVSIAALLALNFGYYRWFAGTRSVRFALGVVPAHVLHHLCNGVSYMVGALLHLASRMGLQLPGALPITPWSHDHAAARQR